MAEQLPADIRPGKFLSGFVAPLRGIRYLLGHPTLLPLAALPLLANMAVLTLMVFILGPHVSTWVSQWVAGIVAPGSAWYYVLVIPLKLLAWFLALATGAVFVNLFGTLIASPFNDMLSAKVETIEGRLPDDQVRSWSQAVARIGLVMLDEAKKWAVYVLVMLCLVPLMLVPVAGHLAFSFLGALVTFWFLGFEYLDYCFSRRATRFTERRQFCWANKGAIVGLGAAITCGTMIPFAGFVVMPLAVVGATLLFLDLAPK